MIEAGYPGFVSVLSIGLMAPAGTPPAIIEKLHQDAVKVLAMPDVRNKLSDSRHGSDRQLARGIRRRLSRRKRRNGRKSSRTPGSPQATSSSSLNDRHMGADRHAVVEIDDVLIEQADAARGDGLADGLRLGGAVQAEERVVAVAIKIERAGAKRIFRAALNARRRKACNAASPRSCSRSASNAATSPCGRSSLVRGNSSPRCGRRRRRSAAPCRRPRPDRAGAAAH